MRTTVTASAKTGGTGVANAVAFHDSTRCPPFAQPRVARRTDPGLTGSVAAARSVAGPAGVIVYAVVCGPPALDGMQPIRGSKSPSRWLPETARKKA